MLSHFAPESTAHHLSKLLILSLFFVLPLSISGAYALPSYNDAGRMMKFVLSDGAKVAHLKDDIEKHETPGAWKEVDEQDMEDKAMCQEAKVEKEQGIEPGPPCKKVRR